MKSIVLNLDKNKTYIVACSFGPDSMALLDAAIKNELKVIVAHVNYHKRDVSNYEQLSLERYCGQHRLPFEVLDTEGMKEQGNFQEWARNLRYNFFKDILKRHKADAILVAHQEDDLIETYLMQKDRGNYVKYWGIAEENELFGIKILRPLLGYTKQELLDYDIENNVPYSIDESNLTDHYTRNKFRHHVVSEMTREDRDKLLKEISLKNSKLKSRDFPLLKDEFLNLTNEEIIDLLSPIMNKVSEHRNLSSSFIAEIKKAFASKSNVEIELTKSILLCSNYGEVNVINTNKLKSYSFKFSSSFDNEFLNIDFSNGAEDRNISRQEKYIVKSINKNDIYHIKEYSVEFRRLAIDWKMPTYLREVWPGIYNENGDLLYIPRYKKLFEDMHSSKFIINLEYFTKF